MAAKIRALWAESFKESIVRIRHIQLQLSFALFALIMTSILCMAQAQEPVRREAVAHQVTLLSQIKHQDFAKANYNFKLGVRGDSETPPTRNIYDVRYGGSALDGDDDWLDVPINQGSRSQIKDLGALEWFNVYDVPILYASPVAHTGEMSLSYDNGKLLKVSPEGTIVKAIVGHMYLVHSKYEGNDLYAMFRVEAIKLDEGECTISWKLVPSPEHR
jgi:hypothetical protein